ncbi:MAG: IS982 family transposase [Pyrinomonadaceae bacterium]|nr:IS982 family transposase [Pyrinomonadaceae bacterium]
MNDDVIITAYVVIDDMMKHLGHQSHVLAQVSDAEVLTVAVAAAQFFHNNHEAALGIVTRAGYLSGRLSVSRCNRRRHQLADWLPLILEALGTLFARGEAFILNSMPLPICKRVRARHCRKVRGRDYCGCGAAKKEKFFGWRLHLVCTPQGVPVSFTMLPGGYHDLTPVHQLTAALPAGAKVFGDKGYHSANDEASILKDVGVRLIPIRKKHMTPHEWADEFDLRRYRKTIETVNSQLERMGIEQLYARSNAGFDIKVHASLLALAWPVFRDAV